MEAESPSKRSKTEGEVGGAVAYTSESDEVQQWRSVAEKFHIKTPAELRTHLEKQHVDVTSLIETKKRERHLVIRLTQKEKDISSLEGYIKELTDVSENRALQLRSSFADPLINELIEALQLQLAETEKRLKNVLDEQRAFQFSPDVCNPKGLQLLSKCRRLQMENDELGRKLDEGLVRKLELELATKLGRDRHLERDYQSVIQAQEKELEEKNSRLKDLEQRLVGIKREVVDSPSVPLAAE